MSRPVVMFVASVVMAMLLAPGAGAHDGIMTPAGHAAEDAVVLTAAQEKKLDAHTRAVSAKYARAAAAAVAGGPQDVGEWGPVVDWPVVGVHVALLPNGKVLAYDSVGDNATETYPVQDHTRATVWDPVTGTQTPVNETGFNIFCSGLAHLIDGRMFIAGGNLDQQLNGIVQTHLFDPATNSWTLGPNMAAGRWYPTVTPLNNGEMLITSGRVDTPEVRTLAGNLRSLSTASLSLPLYPWMDVAPNGLAFYSGPDQTLRALNPTGTGSWQTFGQRDSINRDYGGHAIFDIGKMLVAGGGPSTKDARVIDFNGSTPQVSSTAPMAFGRRQHNLTVLADGTVLATGGNSSGASLVDLNAGVYPAELWSPATGQWRTLAAMQVTRQYHSTALLLPDGRVLSAGGGICGTCDTVGYLAKNAEIFSPPYLFQADGTLAPRPSIDAAPASTTYGATMAIGTPDPASISKVALIRIGSVTHSNNMEQRYVPLSFTAGATSITATAPANANIAPPGIYMLFIIDANGVPSARAHGQRSGQFAASGHAHAAPGRCDIHGARHRESLGDGLRRRRHGDQGRVLQRHDEARRGHDSAVQLHLERRAGRELHPHGTRHGRCWGHHHQRGVQDHRRQQHQHTARGQHHLSRKRRDLPLEADVRRHRHGDRPRRHRDQGRVPRRHHPPGHGHHLALLLQLAKCPGRNPRADRARDRQRRCRRDEQPGQHHCSPEALRAPESASPRRLLGFSLEQRSRGYVRERRTRTPRPPP